MKNNRLLGLQLAVALACLLFGSAQAFAQAPAPTCGTTTWNLTAGQTINVGTVTVCNDATNIYVTYTLTYPGATFGNLHMWVGNNLANLDGGGAGRPAPGQLCGALGGACYDATGLTTYTFTMPFTNLNIVDAAAGCGTLLYVVTHAEVNIVGSDGSVTHETAFGGPTQGPGKGAWWFWGQYGICCDFGPPPPVSYQTAYAKGGYVWTTNNKSNPEKLPSLKLTQNRWGWAINLTATGTTTYEIWAGAGLNNTASGTKVGTLTIAWDGTTAAVTYGMFPPYMLQEVHLYAGDVSPTTIAPGQYGHLDSFAPAGVGNYTFNVPLADTNGTGGVWLVAHAVVSGAF